MKQLILITGLLCGICSGTLSQKNATTIPGTRAVDNVSSMDGTEITIAEWLHFIINNDFDSTLFPARETMSPAGKLLFDDLRKKSAFEYIKLFSRPARAEKWGKIGYMETPALRRMANTDTNTFSMYIPVVGISFEQAARFCAWREAVVNEGREVKLHISLPSLEWYQKVNMNKDSLCGPEAKCDSCSGYQLNYAHARCALVKVRKEAATQGRGLLRADYYWPSKEGLYNIQGNAAEMTATKGVAAGGSFRHYAMASYSNQTQTYSGPEDWLGFRCLITLK